MRTRRNRANFLIRTSDSSISRPNSIGLSLRPEPEERWKEEECSNDAPDLAAHCEFSEALQRALV
jgi:hypothetical protein